MQNITAELSRANGIIDRLVRTAPNVIHLMGRLGEYPGANDRAVIERQLGNEFEVALYQGGVPPKMVSGLGQLLTHSAVCNIDVVLAQHGDDIVVYFLCKTVKAHYDLSQMILSGFMHAVFAVAIQSLASTTVDVYVRADEFNLRLLCLSHPQHKGSLIDTL